MSDDLKFHAAIHQEMAWKHPEMERFAVALVRNALSLLESGVTTFTTDIVADGERGNGPGIAGSVIEVLKHASVLEGVGMTVGGVWYPRRERSTRAGCKSRYVGVYRLCSQSIGQSFLRRHQVPAGQVQMEFNHE